MKALLKTLLFAAVLLALPGLVYGSQVTCLGVDDTSAIQTAIDAARVTKESIDLPIGSCAVRSLNMTNMTGATMHGQGRNVTFIDPIQADVHVIDLTGSYFVTLQDFSLGRAMLTPVVPNTGIFLGYGAMLNNLNTIERVFVSGRFEYGALYIQGACCGTIRSSQFWNYYASEWAYTVTFTSEGLQSQFANVGGASMPGQWTLLDVEIHSMTGAYALFLWQTSTVTMIGGAIASPSCLGSFQGGSMRPLMLGVSLFSDIGGTPHWC